MEQIVFPSNLTFLLFAMLHSMLEKGLILFIVVSCSIDMNFVLVCICVLYWYVYDISIYFWRIYFLCELFGK